MKFWAVLLKEVYFLICFSNILYHLTKFTKHNCTFYDQLLTNLFIVEYFKTLSFDKKINLVINLKNKQGFWCMYEHIY